eukprot:CAMPEP_0117427792 /NCGR_PEP_ID=MMETSP0758-20121206/7591_1 /TAXON_ID=63605 /ORGANISM="Percolomonas cosmopolitus, Strain AE-1 (ATCC 50343)" /LENGTH=702 /DNA_ID=CAMNT_0005213685 /DNA_START=84 /DNA_END=2192 /DNA_ORIENTATION=+
MNIKVREDSVPTCYNFHMMEREVMHEIIEQQKKIEEQSKELKEENQLNIDQRKEAIQTLNTLLAIQDDLQKKLEDDEKERNMKTKLKVVEEARKLINESYGKMIEEERRERKKQQRVVETLKDTLMNLKNSYDERIKELEEQYGFKLKEVESIDELQKQHEEWKEAAMTIEKEFMFRKKRLYDLEQDIATKRKLLKQILDERTGLKAAIIQLRMTEAGAGMRPMIVKEVEQRLEQLDPLKKTTPITTPTKTHQQKHRIPGINDIDKHIHFRPQYEHEEDDTYTIAKKDHHRMEAKNMKFREKYKREKLESYRAAKLEFFSHYYRFRSQKREETDHDFEQARKEYYQHLFAIPFRAIEKDEDETSYLKAKDDYERRIQFRFRDAYQGEEDYEEKKARYEALRTLQPFREKQEDEKATDYAQEKFDYYRDMLTFRDQSLLEMDFEYERERERYFHQLRELIQRTDMELVLGKARLQHIMDYKPIRQYTTKASRNKSSNTYKNAKANNIMELLRLVPEDMQACIVKHVQQPTKKEHEELKGDGPVIPDKFKYFNAFKHSKQFDMKADHFNQMVERLKRIRKSNSTFSRYLNSKTTYASSRKLKHYLQMLVNVHRRKQKTTGNLSIHTRQSIADAFRSLDADHSGSVEPKEFQRALRVLGHNIPLKEIRVMMAELDDDGDGSVDFKEFVDFYHDSIADVENKQSFR